MNLVPLDMKYNPLCHLSNSSSYTHSTVVGITGAKRSGKSLLLARLLVWDMLRGRKVWSTMPVKTPQSLLDKGYPMVKSNEIDWDGLYLLSDEYQEGTIGLDESVYVDDSRTSLSSKNRLMNTIMNQVGHRNLNVYYTVKTQGWMDRRLQFETDLEVRAQDLALSPWGRLQHAKRGDVIRLEMFDKSGAITGKPFNDKFNYKPFNVAVWTHASDYHDAYDTKVIVGLEEMYTSVKVDMKQRVITNKQAAGDIRGDLYKVASELYDKGQHEITTSHFWNIAKAMGIDGSKQTLGQYLPEFGVVRKQKSGGSYVYDLSKLSLSEQGA